MRKWGKGILLTAVASLAVAGCGKPVYDVKKEEAKIPKTVEDILEQPAGKYRKMSAGELQKQKTVDELVKDLQDLDVRGLSDEEKIRLYNAKLVQWTKPAYEAMNIGSMKEVDKNPHFKENYNLQILLNVSDKFDTYSDELYKKLEKESQQKTEQLDQQMNGASN
ncbi:hypothetical protein MUG87_13620 [Ectobacillus sp. JY-23]|uniref:hypothetical protein n=1 Tax=Ectobacillus sp. JY-23 TaxID=2933872 RepID=UPI001FF318F1|nr:hypothetical protein [Ectobacillus sp. JY-23]UOY91544.1 hypothetical protein MUG87_13620 [Ectobacillus sp. JY-23]